jgi:hypothetical protein
MLLLILAAGCVPRRVEAVDLMPLGDGRFWRYQITGGQSTSSLEISLGPAKTGKHGEELFLDTASSQADSYFFRKGQTVGISNAPGLWVLWIQGPVKKGMTWAGALEYTKRIMTTDENGQGFTEVWAWMPSKSGGTKEVSSMRERIEVPAGLFKDCVRVDHRRGAFFGSKYFARGVGMVRSVLYRQQDDGGLAEVLRQDLVEYGTHKE